MQDHVEASVRKALEKLPDTLAHKVHQQLLRNIGEIVSRGFSEIVGAVVIPSLESLLAETTPALVEPATRVLTLLKEKVREEEARTSSLEKLFIQTVDAL